MAEVKLCSVCNKSEATLTCANCGVPLCDGCAKVLHLMDYNPRSMVKADTSLSPLRKGKEVRKVCPKCFVEQAEPTAY